MHRNGFALFYWIWIFEIILEKSAESNIERFNKPLQTMEATTYGFKGFPENYMLQPKRPLRHQPSADVSTDVKRYFRKDSPTEWMPPANQQRMPSPPPQPKEPQQKEPDWLQTKRSSPPPAPQPNPTELQQTISPRYADETPSYRKPPVIRDPLRELTSAERRKKIEEHYQAEEDLAMARRRREKEKYEKIEEQQRMRYGDENKGIDRVRTSMEQRNDMPERKEAFGRAATMPLRTSYSDSFRPRNAPEMLEDQSKQMRRMQEEIDRLKAHDDMSYRPSDRPMHDYNPRAQSEPQTERTFKRYNRDREIFGESDQSIPGYLNVSPRRRPVGQMYNKESTYKSDFDPPFIRHGRRNLGNPNKEPYEPFSPFGMEGSGAPNVDASGHRRTRIAGAMDMLGRELSTSARARRAHKAELLHEIGEQAAYERARKEAEKAYARQGFVEVADVMRQQKVGYPKFEPTGLISERHHLRHMFNTTPYAELSKQRQYHDYLASQIEERNRNIRLGQLEEKRQAREHFRTQDSFFGRRGGGNIKGENLRKVNLDQAIYNPQSTRIDVRNYMGRV